jgi:hypothetical protein
MVSRLHTDRAWQLVRSLTDVWDDASAGALGSRLGSCPAAHWTNHSSPQQEGLEPLTCETAHLVGASGESEERELGHLKHERLQQPAFRT